MSFIFRIFVVLKDEIINTTQKLIAMHRRATPENVTVNRETGEVFATRKEAKDKYGVAYYRKLLRDNIIYFTNYIADDELQKNRPESTTTNA